RKNSAELQGKLEKAGAEIEHLKHPAAKT
ncbi:MAG: hypothetical protein JWQ62_1448, partial [Lacunisphaera sp.]|nr:hypothetical protein [Lacunisphaera sp.]